MAPYISFIVKLVAFVDNEIAFFSHFNLYLICTTQRFENVARFTLN